jgi:predicted ester cyclase
MSVAENIQTMQDFLGHFNPAQAERMARGCRAQVRGGAERTKVDRVAFPQDPVAAKRFLQGLSALRCAFPDLEITLEDTMVEGDKVAARFAVTNRQAWKARASA